MVKNESGTQSKSVSIRPNIVLFIFMIWVTVFPPITLFIFDGVVNTLVLHALTVVEKCAIPVILYLLIAKERPKAVLSISPIGLKNSLYVIGITLSWFPFVSLLFWGVPFLTDTLPTEMIPFNNIWIGILTGGLVIATVEELLYRGPVYHEYRKQGASIWKIALITGAFFGFVHGGVVQVSYAAVWGFGMAFMLYYTRSILAPIMSHIIGNSLGHLLSPMYYVDTYTDLINLMPTFLTVMGAAALVLLPVGVVCWKKMISDNPRKDVVFAKESKAFKISFWVLIAIMIVLFIIRDIVFA